MSLFFTLIVCMSAAEPGTQGVSDETVPVIAIEYGPSHANKFRCECLGSDYGYFIDWPDNQSPQLYVYEKKPARIARLASMDELLAWAAKLPEGACVAQIRTCGSTCAGVPPEKAEELKRNFADRKIRLSGEKEGNFPICTCESVGKTMFKSMDEAKQWLRAHPDAEYLAAGGASGPVHAAQTAGK
jgi:hypothetical protein